MTTTTAAPGPVTLNQLLEGSQLPALPQSAIRLLELSQDPNNGPTEFAVPIEADPGLHSQVLKFVNSSYFGFSREISNVKMAITLVGIRTIKNFSLWSAVFSLMPNPKCGPFDLKVLWQDSLRRGLFSRMVAKMFGFKDAEETFSAGLLQDMAIPLLAKERPADYAEMLEARSTGARLSQLEQERFGWNHAQAAGVLARNWKMPESFAVLVEQHIDTLDPETAKRPDTAAIYLSALLPSNCDQTWNECATFCETYDRLKTPGSLTVRDLLSKVDALFVEFAPVLKIATPGKSLATWYDETQAAAAGAPIVVADASLPVDVNVTT